MAIDRAIKKLNSLSDWLSKKEHAVRFAVILTNQLSGLTPVDTGAARNNWYVSKDGPGMEFDPSKTSQGRETFTRVRTLRPFNTLYVNNNAPYIVRLNEGHSVQAPAGFIEKAVVESVDKWIIAVKNGLRRQG